MGLEHESNNTFGKAPRDIGVALSGGGHRATLFSLGALLYLVDSGANRAVATISSVSGGSICNGFVAQRCDFGTVERSEFDQMAARLVTTLTRRGVVSSTSCSLLLYIIILLIVVVGIIVSFFAYPAWLCILLALVLGVLFLLRGAVVERLLGQALFSDACGRPLRLSALKCSTVAHVLCATDLTTAAPIYFVCWDRGYVFSPQYAWGRGDDVKLATAVRASAAFPGLITAKLFRTRCRGFSPHPAERGGPDRVPAWLFLADGGVWNNLGTQFFERDRTVEAAPGRPVGPYEPMFNHPVVDPGRILIVDGSGGVGPTSTWDLAVPYWSEIRSLLRVTNLLYVNTVRPRLRSIDQNTIGYWRWGDQYDPDYDVPSTVASLRKLPDWWGAGRLQSALDLSGPHAEKFANRIEAWVDYHQRLPDNLCPELKDFPQKDELAEFCAKIGTHLFPVPDVQAVALLMRGYLSTMRAMHITFGARLVEFSSDRFLRLLDGMLQQ